MMEIFINDDIELKYKPFVTTITKCLNDFPNIKHFFNILINSSNIKHKQIGQPQERHNDIVRNRYQSAYALFFDYFVRKHLSSQYNIAISDPFAEKILQSPEDYIIGENARLHDAIKEHYEMYKDPKTKAMNIIKSIRIVSLSRIIYFGEDIPKHEYAVNDDNLRETIRYFESLPFKSVILSPNLDCDYFNGKGDIIFDNDVIYKTITNTNKLYNNKFYQTILYGFGFYKQTGVKIKKITIYNTLMNLEHSVELDNMDYDLFDRVLKRDVVLYCRLQELLKDKLILDLSLFSEVEGEK